MSIQAPTGQAYPASASQRTLFDAHVHPDLMPNAREVVDECAREGMALLACTVTPDGWLRARDEGMGSWPGVRLAAGAHPWWVADGRVGSEDVDMLCQAIAHDEVRLVGEVGLDFSPRRMGEGDGARAKRDAQTDAFARIARACGDAAEATGMPRVLSIHSVSAATQALDILEAEGLLGDGPRACRCVFHWFSGSCDELWRAINADCWFSVGVRLLGTHRGREYCRLMPADKILLETDLPASFDEPCPIDAVATSLRNAVAAIARACDSTPGGVARTTTANAEALLGSPLG